MLTFLLIILGLYLSSRIMIRWIMPWMLRRYLRQMQERMNFDGAQQKSHKTDSSVHIPRKQKSKSNRTYQSAEYVDFEDVDNEK